MKYIQKLQEKGVSVAEEVSGLFAGELNPVAPKAQKKVPIPEGQVLLAYYQFVWILCTNNINTLSFIYNSW